MIDFTTSESVLFSLFIGALAVAYSWKAIEIASWIISNTRKNSKRLKKEVDNAIEEFESDK